MFRVLGFREVLCFLFTVRSEREGVGWAYVFVFLSAGGVVE